MALIRANNGSGGGGTPTLKQWNYVTLNSNSYMSIGTINESGLLVMDIDNSNQVGWQNNTKGTSGKFEDYNGSTTSGYAYASLEVSAGDDVKVYRNSSVTRNLRWAVVG